MPIDHSLPRGKNGRNHELMYTSSDTSSTAQDSGSQHVPLSQQALAELRWWCKYLMTHNVRAICTPHPDVIIHTDASLLGSRGVSYPYQAYGSLECCTSLCKKKENITVLMWLEIPCVSGGSSGSSFGSFEPPSHI